MRTIRRNLRTELPPFPGSALAEREKARHDPGGGHRARHQVGPLDQRHAAVYEKAHLETKQKKFRFACSLSRAVFTRSGYNSHPVPAVKRVYDQPRMWTNCTLTWRRTQGSWRKPPVVSCEFVFHSNPEKIKHEWMKESKGLSGLDGRTDGWT